MTLLPEKYYTLPESVSVVQTHSNRSRNKTRRSQFSRLNETALFGAIPNGSFQSHPDHKKSWSSFALILLSLSC